MVGFLTSSSRAARSVVANKLRGIWPALPRLLFCATGLEHDAMNGLVLGSRVIGQALAADSVGNFLRASFSNEERHARRLKKVEGLESRRQ
ncbi:MAG: RpiB/LacA/LacB family sugar-phosphate isomerase [Gammaproteobacteria bacterium]